MELNLNTKHVNQFWQLKSEKFLDLMQKMEAGEYWTLDKSHLAQIKLAYFEESVKKWSNKEFGKYSDQLTAIMNYLPVSKACYFLLWVDNNKPGVTFHFVMECLHDSKKGDKRSQLFINRLETIQEAGLLQEMFSPVRTRLISSLISNAKEED